MLLSSHVFANSFVMLLPNELQQAIISVVTNVLLFCSKSYPASQQKRNLMVCVSSVGLYENGF